MLVLVLIFGGDTGVAGVVISVGGIHSVGDVDNVGVGGDCSDGQGVFAVGDGGSSGESVPLS